MKTQIIEYSEKAIAVIGETKPIKDQLKALGGKFNPRLNCGAGWIFSVKRRAELDALLGGKIEIAKSQKQSEEEKTAIILKMFEGAEGQYYKGEDRAREIAKNSYRVVEASGHFFIIGKATIQKDFCHPDEPREEVTAWYKVCRTYEYFESANLAAYNADLERLDNSEARIKRHNWDGCSFVYTPFLGVVEEGTEPLTEDIKEALKSAYNEAIDLHKKRLQTWWKKYGANKLHCWTYWADR